MLGADIGVEPRDVQGTLFPRTSTCIPDSITAAEMSDGLLVRQAMGYLTRRIPSDLTGAHPSPWRTEPMTGQVSWEEVRMEPYTLPLTPSARSSIWIERLTTDQKVGGSSPSGRATETLAM
jgi:hypothetical protein